MKKIKFDLEKIAGLHNVEIGEAGLGSAIWETALDYWELGYAIDTDHPWFDDCYDKARDEFKKALNIEYVPCEYDDDLLSDTLKAMTDSYSSTYIRAVIERIEDLAIKTVKVNAPCAVHNIYFTNYAGEKCSIFNAYHVVAEVTEKEALAFARKLRKEYDACLHCDCSTMKEWLENHDIEEELESEWPTLTINWEDWDRYGAAGSVIDEFDEVFDSYAITRALADKNRHERRLKGQIKHKAPLYAREPLFGGLLGKCVGGVG